MWLDTCVAVPVVGLQTEPSFRGLFRYPERLQPILDEAFSRDKEITMNIDAGGSRLRFRTKQGFTYTVSADNIVVAFAYSPSETRRAGQLPVPEIPVVQKFSHLVNETVNQMVRVLGCLATEPPNVVRFGLLAKVLMEKSKAVPGIADMITHHNSFFPGEVIKAKTTFLVNIEVTEAHIDRCHHNYEFDDSEKPDDLSVGLDWQRVFLEPQRFASRVEERLHVMKETALAYFQRCGEGGLKDA